MSKSPRPTSGRSARTARGARRRGRRPPAVASAIAELVTGPRGEPAPGGGSSGRRASVQRDDERVGRRPRAAWPCRCGSDVGRRRRHRLPVSAAGSRARPRASLRRSAARHWCDRRATWPGHRGARVTANGGRGRASGRSARALRVPSIRRPAAPVTLSCCDSRPLRPIPHRLPARRRRPHRALQLAAGPPRRRRVRAPHRGHRRRALVRRDGRRHPPGDALARHGLGRRARGRRAARTVLPVAALRSAPRRRRAARRGRPRLLRLHAAREVRRGAQGGRGARRGVALRPRRVGAARGAGARAGLERHAAGDPLQGARGARRVHRSGQGSGRVRQHEHRRLRHRPRATACRSITCRWSATTSTWRSPT